MKKKSEEIIIRLFNMDDYDEVLGLWKRTDGMVLNYTDTPKNIETFIKYNKGGSFVAEINKRIVGVILSGHDGRRGTIYHFAVSSSNQGKGIGSKLADSALAFLKNAGIERCNILILSKNTLGKAVWAKLGWRLRDDIEVMSKNID